MAKEAIDLKAIKEKNLVLRSKVWLELEGRPFLGEGRAVMLKAIRHHGSIIDASRETGISYRRMRGAIRDMEDTSGISLVKVHRGGGDGGGAVLTETAVTLLEYYEKISDEHMNVMNLRLRNFF